MATWQWFILLWLLLLLGAVFFSHVYVRYTDRKARFRRQEARFFERETKRVNDLIRSENFKKADRYYHDF